MGRCEGGDGGAVWTPPCLGVATGGAGGLASYSPISKIMIYVIYLNKAFIN